MGKEIITFGNTEIEKQKFCCKNLSFFIKDLDIDNLLIPNKTSSDEKNKYFIGYLDNELKIKPLHTMLMKSYKHMYICK